MPDFELDSRVFSVQRNAAAVLALLGGSDEDRQEYWEIKKGITSRAIWELIGNQYQVIESQLEQIQMTLHTIDEVAALELAEQRV